MAKGKRIIQDNSDHGIRSEDTNTGKNRIDLLWLMPFLLSLFSFLGVIYLLLSSSDQQLQQKYPEVFITSSNDTITVNDFLKNIEKTISSIQNNNSLDIPKYVTEDELDAAITNVLNSGYYNKKDVDQKIINLNQEIDNLDLGTNQNVLIPSLKIGEQRNPNSTYDAVSDGFVVASISALDTDATGSIIGTVSGNGFSYKSATSVHVIKDADFSTSIEYNSLVLPVNKGSKWVISSGPKNEGKLKYEIRWIPLD